MRLIDADVLIHELNNSHYPGAHYFDAGISIAIGKVCDAPTIEPERTGRWVHDGYAFKGDIDWMHCSECGHKDSWSVATRTPFCGWCGARMEETNEGD